MQATIDMGMMNMLRIAMQLDPIPHSYVGCPDGLEILAEIERRGSRRRKTNDER